MEHRPHLRIDSADPEERGRQRAAQLGTSLGRASAAYLELFQASGLSPERVRKEAERTEETVADWRPELATEIRSLANAGQLPAWHLFALNARTEILASVPGGRPGECSTVAMPLPGSDPRTNKPLFGIQTWDWHMELRQFWHTQEVTGAGYRTVGLTEHGILGKIGMNSAGLGLHFNILGHRSDAAGGVPVHLLATAVLRECATAEEALRVIRAAPVSASTALTLVDPHRAISAEVSPVGVFPVENAAGEPVVRTNHFLSSAPSAAEKTELYQPDSGDRYALLTTRLSTGLPRTLADFTQLLSSGEGEAALCCEPDMSLGLGERWATLATCITDPEARRLLVLDGSPLDAFREPWRELSAEGPGSSGASGPPSPSEFSGAAGRP